MALKHRSTGTLQEKQLYLLKTPQSFACLTVPGRFEPVSNHRSILLSKIHNYLWCPVWVAKQLKLAFALSVVVRAAVVHMTQ